MKVVVALVLLALSSTTAHAAGRCDNDALIKSLGRLEGGHLLKVTEKDGAVELELVHGTVRDVALRVSCDAIEVPLADHLERPTKGASTVVIDAIVVARTADGAVSLDFPAGVADKLPVSVLVMEDDSVSVVRGGVAVFSRGRAR